MTHAPALALTFDDHYVDEWLAAADIFKSHGVCATFFVVGFPNVPSMAVMKLHKLVDRGHEIGFHSVSHANAVEGVRDHGLEQYIQTEIAPGMDGMTLMGFRPTAFAFPYNAYTDELVSALRPQFKVLRARADSLAEAFSSAKAGPLIKSRSCDTVRADGVTLRSADDIVAELRHAAATGRSISLYGHGISDTPVSHHHMTLRGLDYVLWSAKRLGFRFVTASNFFEQSA
jgi:peptidoglycan/xylan/chitin deacetylase (PgdA/CDA1 family)